MGLMGNGEGNTVLILTDAESRLLRAILEAHAAREREAYTRQGLTDQTALSGQPTTMALEAFNRGIQRGTAKIQEEFAAMQKAKRAGK